jgi:hypothetical protein
MDLEQKIKNSLLFLISLFSTLSIFGLFYSKDLAFYCAPITLIVLALFLSFQAYIRIQHNIDKRSDYLLDVEKKILNNQKYVEEYIDNFKKDTLSFSEKLLEKLELDKQKTDRDFLSEKADLDRKMEIAFDKLEFSRKETNYKIEKISEKINDISVSMKVLESLYKIEALKNKEKDEA